MPIFTAYWQGKPVSVLCDSGAQLSVASSKIFFNQENSENISTFDRTICAANQNVFTVKGALKSLKVNVFPSFDLNFTEIPLMEQLPVDIIIVKPQLTKLGFSLPKGKNNCFILGGKIIKMNQKDYRIAKTPSKITIEPSFNNVITVKNPYHNISSSKYILISPLSKLTINNKFLVNADIVCSFAH